MAYKVFLCEDESVIREGLRDNIPWEQYGFRFVGEAGDGEMALPAIRKVHPDVLITDIKMPFMDGLALSHIIKKEQPDMKIIIISGYDDFEYARQAIKEGVEQYLLKPITRSMLQKALSEVKEKLDEEARQKESIRKYQYDMKEYEQSFCRNFFEKVFEGRTPLSEIYEEAKKHSLDIDSPFYNLILLSVEERGGDKEAAAQCREELMRYFLRFSSQSLAFRWSLDVHGILIKGEEEKNRELTGLFMDKIEEICSRFGGKIDWYAAAGKGVTRFSMLGECYSYVNQILSYRFFVPGVHILEEGILGDLSSGLLAQRDAEGYGKKDKDIKKALDYIGENYARDDLSLNEVAAVIDVSPNYFSATFSQEMGETFVEYVTRCRMEKAKELLMDPNVRSGDVGALVGYKNSQYFSYVFKKTQGCSPREWRKG